MCLLTRLYSIGLCYSRTSYGVIHHTQHREVALYCLCAGELSSIILLMINLLHRASYIAYSTKSQGAQTRANSNLVCYIKRLISHVIPYGGKSLQGSIFTDDRSLPICGFNFHGSTHSCPLHCKYCIIKLILRV